MKTYLASKMGAGLKSAPDMVVKLTVAGATFTTSVGDIPDLLHAEGLAKAWPISARTEQGVGVPVFPVIKPLTGKAAWGLQKIVGYPVPVGDGLSCGYQSKADQRLHSLLNLGVEMDELVVEWMVGIQPKGANAAQMELPLKPRPSRFTQAERDAAVADSPF